MRTQTRLERIEQQVQEQRSQEVIAIPDDLFFQVILGSASPHVLRPYLQHMRHLTPGVEEGLERKLTDVMWKAREA